LALSELLSVFLFIASIVIYSLKAGRNSWWFAATLVVLGLFVILNITLYASDYFTGDGINDAVIYTLTNSLAGAGIGKYLLPGAGLLAWFITTLGIGLIGMAIKRTLRGQTGDTLGAAIELGEVIFLLALL